MIRMYVRRALSPPRNSNAKASEPVFTTSSLVAPMFYDKAFLDSASACISLDGSSDIWAPCQSHWRMTLGTHGMLPSAALHVGRSWSRSSKGCGGSDSTRLGASTPASYVPFPVRHGGRKPPVLV
jgi:hypothetical protein